MQAILKPYILSLTVAAGLGFLSLPARADNTATIQQESNQSTAIVGNGNTSVTQNIQIGTVIQRGNGSFKLPKNNNVILKQQVDQATGISGNGNVVGTQNEQISNVEQVVEHHGKKPKFRLHRK
jgi:uncharacterized protein with beta-barrel porin domain